MRPETEGERESRIVSERRSLPDVPGVYLFKDGEGEVIYVGKAHSIRKRVASHSAVAIPR